MNFSFWELDTYFKNVDITIIGSGIVGLNCAYTIKKRNPKLKVVVIERGMLPLGASSKNAGFACYGSPSELIDDLTHHTENEVFSLVEKRWKGLQKLRKNLGDKNIDFHNWGGYEVFDNNKAFNECAEKLQYLNKHISKITGIKTAYKIADKNISKFGLAGFTNMIKNVGEGQIDTGKMLTSLTLLAQNVGVLIINGLTINTIEDDTKKVELKWDNFSFTSKKVIVCTNGFAKQLLPELQVNPARAQVLITSPIKNLRLKGTFHFDKGFYYFRNIGNRVLFGGGRNLDIKTEETTSFGLTPLVQNKLEWMLKNKILPNTKYEIEHRWSGIMGLGNQKTTIVKAITKNTYCAVRMGGMGIAIGSLVGEDAAIMVERDTI